MSECNICGRQGPGHWIGCAASKIPPPAVPLTIVTDHGEVPNPDVVCTYDVCEQPRRSADKRVKFCTEHSDPKNRK